MYDDSSVGGELEERSPRKWLICGSVLTVLAVLCSVISVVIPLEVHKALEQGLRDHFVLDSKDAKDYDRWQSSDADHAPAKYVEMYAWNITNPHEILEGKQAHGEWIGPIWYQKRWRQLNVTWVDEEANLIEYTPYTFYTYKDEESRKLGEQKITSINMVVQGVSSLGLEFLVDDIRSLDKLTGLLNNYTDYERLFVHRPIQEIFWGYSDDPLLHVLSEAAAAIKINIPPAYPGLQNNMTSEAMAFERNGRSRVYTGKDAENEMRKYVTWNDLNSFETCRNTGQCWANALYPTGLTSLPMMAWGSMTANSVAASEGQQFHFHISEDDVLTISAAAHGLTRKFTLLNQNAETRNTKGITTRHFTLDPYTYMPVSMVPESHKEINAAYYQVDTPNGLLNATSVQRNIPVFMSQPYFLHGDPSLRKAAGMADPSDPAYWETFIDVEPITGSTMEYHFHLQPNVYIQPLNLTFVNTTGNPGAEDHYFKNLKPMYMPLAIIHRNAIISQNRVDAWNNNIKKAQEVQYWVRLSALIIGLASIVAANIVLVGGCRRLKGQTAFGVRGFHGSVQDKSIDFEPLEDH